MNKKMLACLVTMVLTGSAWAMAEEAVPVSTSAENTSALSTAAVQESNLHVDNTKWHLDADNHIYYQIGIPYCRNPEAPAYESLAIFVPEAYLAGTDNGDGTYTVTVNKKAQVGKYTAETAPVLMPVNTGGYAAQRALTSYYSNGLSTYTDHGLIYVYAGCRGRDNGTNEDGTTYDGGAPWGVTDLKAAVRFLRYNKDQLPGDTDKIITFGHSGGGAQSALMGATGNSPLFTPYLTRIGAAMTDDKGQPVSDSIYGAMAWCPITSLDVANEAYEWMMGQYSTDGTRAYGTWTRSLSRDMARAYIPMLNQMRLKDENGNLLTLSPGSNGIGTSGSYYDYEKKVIEESLNHFLQDTTFPYTTGQTDFHVDGGFPGEVPRKFTPMSPNGKPMPKRRTTPVTYNTAEDYINALNGDDPWITYDKETNTATIKDIESFVTHMKKPTKDVGAFDDINLEQAENRLFGNGENNALHFDQTMADILEKNSAKYQRYADYDSSIPEQYAEDMNNVDSLGVSRSTRMDMYNPMYYVCQSYNGYGTSTPAPYWRINTGLFQSDTALNTELNLALALKQDKDVKDVQFTTVWEKEHTMAERKGTSTENLINWVDQICG
jgi:hypothetical protein